ncbi:GldG family protein [Chloroflexota bacterium]
MQSTPNVYRFSGLIAVLGLLALVVGLIVMVLLPIIRYAAWSILMLGILLLTTAFIIDFRRVRSTLTGMHGRFGTGATAMTSIFIGIILLVNAISIGNYHRFDATGLAQFTIAPQTKDVLSKLETPVQALCFFTPTDPYGGLNSYVTSLLTEYQDYTDKLKIEYIDPDEHPDQARQYGVQMYSTVIFESGARRRLVSPQEIVQVGTDQQGNPQITGVEAEHAFTSAILEVTGIIQKKVYFLTGHGENNIFSEYSNAKEGLLDNLYQVDTLDLAGNPSIPDDCATLIIAGSQELLPSEEVEVIEQYLESGRQALFLVNPDPPQGIKQLLSNWGIEIGDGIVIDPSSYVAPSIDSPMVPRTRNFFDLPETYFPGAAAIIPHPEYIPTLTTTEGGEVLSQITWRSEDSNIQMYMLMWTSVDSWLEMNFDSLEEPEFDEGTDLKGPQHLGFLIFTPPSGENEDEQGTTLVVIGDSDFASNQHFYNGNNGNLFLKSVELLTAGIELISIERKVLPFRRLIVGPEATRFINYSSIGLLPLLVLAIGGITWWRRR